MFRKLLLPLLFVFSSAWVIGCGAQKAASVAVAQFHGRLDHQDYGTIYKNADEGVPGSEQAK